MFRRSVVMAVHLIIMPVGGAALGKHTKEVLLEVGYSEDEIQGFQRDGLFG